MLLKNPPEVEFRWFNKCEAFTVRWPENPAGVGRLVRG